MPGSFNIDPSTLAIERSAVVRRIALGLTLTKVNAATGSTGAERIDPLI